MLPLGLLYILIAPGLVFSTVWCGFHYGTDAVLGCLVGTAAVIFGHWMVQVRFYQRPQCDVRYGVAEKSGGARSPSYYDMLPMWRDDNFDSDTVRV